MCKNDQNAHFDIKIDTKMCKNQLFAHLGEIPDQARDDGWCHCGPRPFVITGSTLRHCGPRPFVITGSTLRHCGPRPEIPSVHTSELDGQCKNGSSERDFDIVEEQFRHICSRRVYNFYEYGSDHIQKWD